MDDLKIFQLQDNPRISTKEIEYIPPEQSANVLFKFLWKIEYLKDILKKKAILPRYYEETIEYLNLDSFKKIAFPMSCFCDIHLNKLVPHMRFYGQFGIGLNKEWGINVGIQPIHYVNPSSYLSDDFRVVFSKALESNDDSNLYESYSNYLLSHLLFMKPLEGEMLRDGEYKTKNFHDEREWRYIPKIKESNTELPLIVPQLQMIPKVYNMYSNGVVMSEKLWLKFEYENIKYLIVETADDRYNLINFIMNEIETPSEERMLLVSKILVFNELREDW